MPTPRDELSSEMSISRHFRGTVLGKSTTPNNRFYQRLNRSYLAVFLMLQRVPVNFVMEH